MLPFSQEEFYDLFAAYNTAIWPAQLIALAVGAAVIAALWASPRLGRLATLGGLAVLWAWNGIAYHIMFFATINPAAIAFGIIFVVQAALLVIYGLRCTTIEFAHNAPMRRWGWMLVGYATLVYPLLGIVSGHVYPKAPVFGVTPCPLVIFTFGVLLFARQTVSWKVLVIPLTWSLIGGSAAALLGVYQDWALPLSAIIAVLANGRKAGAAVNRHDL